jgi:hypothetical protein
MASQASKREREDDETTHSPTPADGADPRHVEVMDVVMQEPDAPGLYPHASIIFDGRRMTY